MNVIIEGGFLSRNDKPTTLQEYVEGKLSGYDYDSGQLESLSRQANRNTEAIARLLEKLAELRVLKLDDVPGIVGGYEALARVD